MKIFVLFLSLCTFLPAQTYRFATNLGNIDVTLLPESAPRTVENFLNYANRGAYNNSFFHRSVENFIIQGGGFTFTTRSVPIPQDPPVVNEYRLSNARGTIAMAKLGNDPNSATNQWFFNLKDNSAELNNQNGGFTVFGRVDDEASLAVIDRIAGLRRFNGGFGFEELPLQNYVGGTVTTANLVMVRSITALGDSNPAISENGVASGSNFGGATAAAPGSYIEIYGTNLSATSRGWATADFNEGRAPTTLDEVSVTVDGKAAFVNYVSPGQINVQVPGDVAVGGSVPVVVTTRGRSSAAVSLNIRTAVPGLLAPASFRVSDRQYAAAVRPATGALVGNGSIPNVPNAPAVPGETLTFYGIGFGAVANGTVAGQIAAGTAALTAPVEFRFGDVPAQVSYAGLAPGLVGVYQFNVAVPAATPRGDVALTVRVGGEAIAQQLFLPVQTN